MSIQGPFALENRTMSLVDIHLLENEPPFIGLKDAFQFLIAHRSKDHPLLWQLFTKRLLKKLSPEHAQILANIIFAQRQIEGRWLMDMPPDENDFASCVLLETMPEAPDASGHDFHDAVAILSTAYKLYYQPTEHQSALARKKQKTKPPFFDRNPQLAQSRVILQEMLDEQRHHYKMPVLPFKALGTIESEFHKCIDVYQNKIIPTQKKATELADQCKAYARTFGITCPMREEMLRCNRQALDYLDKVVQALNSAVKLSELEERLTVCESNLSALEKDFADLKVQLEPYRHRVSELKTLFHLCIKHHGQGSELGQYYSEINDQIAEILRKTLRKLARINSEAEDYYQQRLAVIQAGNDKVDQLVKPVFKDKTRLLKPWHIVALHASKLQTKDEKQLHALIKRLQQEPGVDFSLPAPRYATRWLPRSILHRFIHATTPSMIYQRLPTLLRQDNPLTATEIAQRKGIKAELVNLFKPISKKVPPPAPTMQALPPQPLLYSAGSAGDSLPLRISSDGSADPPSDDERDLQNGDQWVEIDLGIPPPTSTVNIKKRHRYTQNR